MNYNLVQSKYFLVFIAVAALAFSTIPIMRQSFAEVSDSYLISQVQRIQGEMLFMGQEPGVFRNACISGPIAAILHETNRNTKGSFLCRTNENYSRLMVYLQLEGGSFYAADSTGAICQLFKKPNYAISCKHAL